MKQRRCLYSVWKSLKKSHFTLLVAKKQKSTLESTFWRENSNIWHIYDINGKIDIFGVKIQMSHFWVINKQCLQKNVIDKKTKQNTVFGNLQKYLIWIFTPKMTTFRFPMLSFSAKNSNIVCLKINIARFVHNVVKWDLLTDFSNTVQK